MKIAIVAPVHIQPSERWVSVLQNITAQVTVIIVDDSDGRVKLPSEFRVYDYYKQDKELGSLAPGFKQFRKSSACKNFGTWLAYKEGFDVIIVIDSDCCIYEDFLTGHLSSLARPGDGWANPLVGTGWYSRGFPYHLRKLEKWAHMGLWDNELDLYGSDRVAALPVPPPKLPAVTYNVAQFFPLSGMNVSFKREAIPFMCFLPNFKSPAIYPEPGVAYTRHDDIWGGYIFQKAAKAHGKTLSYGYPYVYHDTVVIPKEDAAEEVGMIRDEKAYYQMIDEAIGTRVDSAAALFSTLGYRVKYTRTKFSGLASAFDFWRDAFEKGIHG